MGLVAPSGCQHRILLRCNEWPHPLIRGHRLLLHRWCNRYLLRCVVLDLRLFRIKCGHASRTGFNNQRIFLNCTWTVCRRCRRHIEVLSRIQTGMRPWLTNIMPFSLTALGILLILHVTLMLFQGSGFFATSLTLMGLSSATRYDGYCVVFLSMNGL